MARVPRKLRGRIKYIDSTATKLTIPFGPRFQADLPDWTGQPGEYSNTDTEDRKSDHLKWLGTQSWPIEGACTERNVIGKGRPENCLCLCPGSVECVKYHITQKRNQLKSELGPAFWSWKFDEMGEEVSKLWSSKEQKAFEHLIKTNPISQGKSFLEPALECFASRNKENIVSYYFNVHVPKRISMMSTKGSTLVDSDDDEEAAAEDSKSKGTGKRSRTESVPLHSPKKNFLSGCR